MTEIWELIDINRQKTGQLHKRGEEVPAGLYHLVVDVWVQKPDGTLLLTQRHPDKGFGLLWECSRGSVVAGENGIDAAVRELYEEVGIKANVNEVQYKGHTVHTHWIT